ncbi:MAG: indole-3-glycerol-phosphate synthase [Promethearchaeota archaeon]|nr:MAG: indole-3-glycerol-phosphate synthase [Candidatus Lokiarchaeota archaeon]
MIGGEYGVILDEIIEKRKKSLAQDYDMYKDLDDQIQKVSLKPISQNIKDDEISIISEIKPSSPSLGNIRKSFDVRKLALNMEAAGVAGLSVLTEPDFFNGSYNNLKMAVESTDLPCLMKDFVIDEFQLKIANALGATNILLINLIGNLEKMYEKCLNYNLEPLIEIHNIEEIDDLKKLIEIGFNPTLIGVNNRNLKTLKIDLNTSKILIPKLKRIFGKKIKVISESGIKTREDIDFVGQFGADAVLIGSSIMKSIDIYEKILSLRSVI